MDKVSEVVGRPVVSVDSGERVGRVVDVLLNAESQQLVGVVLAGGVFGAEQVLLYSDTQTLGRDAVLARRRSAILDTDTWRQKGVEVVRSSTLRGRRVLTNAGHELGTVADVYVDGDSGRVEAFEVHGAAFAGLIETRARVPLGDGVTVGADAVLVPEELVPDDAIGHPPRHP
jgi:uncharacterized protein YrrD